VLPTLEVGKALPVNLSNSGTDESSTSSEQLTLREIDRFTDGTQRAQNGEFVCVVPDIKNVGTAEGDTYTSAHWVGADGKVASGIETIGGACEAKGLPDSILGQDNPGPGQYISGTISYDVPTDRPDAIAVEDRNGMLLFRINYAPESATVKVLSNTMGRGTHMAQKVIVQMTDDLDGDEANETVSFAIDGKAYEIDLSEKNADKLRSALHPFMDGGRRLKAVRGGKTTARGTANRERSAEIREWARSAGIKVNDRGRIPAHVIEQYEAAH
jgi:hypothetical protein